MGLGMCIQNRGLRGSDLEGPMQDTALDWIPYPQGTEHWMSNISHNKQDLHERWQKSSIMCNMSRGEKERSSSLRIENLLKGTYHCVCKLSLIRSYE